MLAEVQTAAVALLDTARQSPPAGGWPGEELSPKVVRPYLAELQDAKRLLTVAPAVFVELNAGGIVPIGDAGALRIDHALTLVLVARNLAGREAAAHDGARLVDWTLARLVDAQMTIGRRRIEGMAYKRLLSDRDLWACRLDVALARA